MLSVHAKAKNGQLQCSSQPANQPTNQLLFCLGNTWSRHGATARAPCRPRPQVWCMNGCVKGRGRAEQGKAEQGRAGQGRAGQGGTGAEGQAKPSRPGRPVDSRHDSKTVKHAHSLYFCSPCHAMCLAPPSLVATSWATTHCYWRETEQKQQSNQASSWSRSMF